MCFKIVRSFAVVTVIYILTQFSKSIGMLTIMKYDVTLKRQLSPYIANSIIPSAVVNLPIYVAMIEEFRTAFFALIRHTPANQIGAEQADIVPTWAAKRSSP